jgi:hypothetical protein
MRYDTYEYTEPARTEFGDGLFTFDEYIPKRTDVSITERPEVMRAFGEQSLDDYMGHRPLNHVFMITTTLMSCHEYHLSKGNLSESQINYVSFFNAP